MTTRRFSDRVSSMVAVLIMIVSLLAAGFAYLDSQAQPGCRCGAARRGGRRRRTARDRNTRT